MAEARQLLADRYRLVREIGRGGMGVVWEARDERLERPVAVKELRPQVGLSLEESELAKNRAMREARITARLHHRNAVPVFDVVEHDGQPCLIMQFVPSVPLSAELREGGSLTVHDAARVGAQVGSALASAHALDIVHRDVKPGNILITDDGTALISDFGISHALGDATLTSTGLVHGTPAYLAPEVARGAESSFASDVFSLGATLYTCLEGGPPFGTDSNSIALLYRIASGDFAPPQRAGSLTPVLMEMLRVDPAERPSMSEVAARLAAVETEDLGVPATVVLPAAETRPEAPRESTTTTQVRRSDAPAAFAAPAAAGTAGAAAAAAPVPVAVPPAAGPPPGSQPPPEADRPRPRRRGRVVAVVALLVGLVVLGTAVVTGRVGGGSGTEAAPGTAGSSPAPVSSRSASSSATSSSSAASSASASASASSDSSSPSASTEASPSTTPSSTSTSGEPTAAELEAAVAGYYALVPDDTDQAWPLLTSDYQQKTSGGRQAYEQFWGQVDSIKVSKVDATPPSRVDATLTYRRGDATAVERTRFRLVREDGVLKIASSTVTGRG